MVRALCLFTCALAVTGSATGSEWQLSPRLSRGQELVYAGSFSEETRGKSVQFSRSYQLESRVLVLAVSAQESEVALLTLLRQRGAKTAPGDKLAEPSSVHLEVVKVNSQGRVTAESGSSLSLPLEGPAFIECGAFLEQSGLRAVAGKKWQTKDEGRPPQTWQVVGPETVNGTPCVKLIGLQQSEDWDQPRADQTAWRRRDTVWMLPNLGIAYRVERVLERREPARRDPTQKLVTQYTLDNQVIYPGQLFEDRRQEILQYRHLAQALQPLLREPERTGPKGFEPHLAKIVAHIESRPATPYREALRQLQRRVEAARRGEVTVEAPIGEAAPVATVIALGQKAPDFVVPDLVTHESARLRRFLGRPILLVFYSPTSKNARSILEFAQSLTKIGNRSEFTVLGLALSNDTEAILKQRKDFELTFPILSGQGLHLTYAVEATPKFVILDSTGVVRETTVGWGREMPQILTDELQRWKKRMKDER